MPGEAHPVPPEFLLDELRAADDVLRRRRLQVEPDFAQAQVDDIRARLGEVYAQETKRAQEAKRYPTSPALEQERHAARERHLELAGTVVGHLIIGFVSARFAARQLVRFTGALAVARGSGRGLSPREARRLTVPALALIRVASLAAREGRAQAGK